MKTLEKLQKSKSVEHVNGNGNGNGNDTTLSPAATSQQLDEPVTKGITNIFKFSTSLLLITLPLFQSHVRKYSFKFLNNFEFKNRS